MVKKILNYFERIIILSLLFLMGIVILISTYDLAVLIFQEVFINVGEENKFILLDIVDLIEVFSFFLLILIGIELFETIKYYLDKHVLNAEVILIVALTAISRKVIILDYEKYEPITVVGIGCIIIALALGFYFIKKAEIFIVGNSDQDKKKEE